MATASKEATMKQATAHKENFIAAPPEGTNKESFLSKNKKKIIAGVGGVALVAAATVGGVLYGRHTRDGDVRQAATSGMALGKGDNDLADAFAKYEGSIAYINVNTPSGKICEVPFDIERIGVGAVRAIYDNSDPIIHRVFQTNEGPQAKDLAQSICALAGK